MRDQENDEQLNTSDNDRSSQAAFGDSSLGDRQEGRPEPQDPRHAIDQGEPIATRGTADVIRVDSDAEDSGEIEILADGSVSIPVLEEELVITKRIVTRERLIVRKKTHFVKTRVEEDLKRERVRIQTTGDGIIKDAVAPPPTREP